MEEHIRKAKRANRKELREALGDQLGGFMANEDLDLITQHYLTLERSKVALMNQKRSHIENNILKQTKYWDEIRYLMGGSDEDKSKAQDLIKKALKEEGYTKEDITDLRDEKLALDSAYQLQDVMNREYEKLMLVHLLKLPIFSKYLNEIEGIGVPSAAKLLYYIKDITRFPNVGKLWRYCDLDVDENGNGSRRQSGQKEDYQHKLKSLVAEIIASNFIKKRGSFSKIYYERKAVTRNQDKWTCDAHRDRDGKRVMAKRFLAEFWDSYYLLRGLKPPTLPYVVQHKGHDMQPKIAPINSDRGFIYGWNDDGVLDKDSQVLYDWDEWKEYVQSITFSSMYGHTKSEPLPV